MNWAVVVVDMLKDSLNTEKHFGISTEATKIIPNINELITLARSQDRPIIFACDSFLPEDFIFKGAMKPHSLRGTEGSEIAEGLDVRPHDLIMPKRRMSSFFKTDLDITLREKGIDTIAIAGIAVQFCVMLTAFDGISHGFQVRVITDCTAAHKPEVHRLACELYRKTPFYPLMKVIELDEFKNEVSSTGE